jgi:hypothetical protein
VDDDPSVLEWMVAPVAECVNRSTIEKARTPGAKALREWTKGCLAMAAETAFQIRRDRRAEDGKRGAGLDGGRLMNVA